MNRIGDKKDILQILGDLESQMHAQHLSNLSEQQADEPLHKLKELEEAHLTRLFKDKERVIKNIERARSVVQKQ